MKKELTNTSKGRYAESLKLVNAAFAPVRFAIFLYLPNGRMIAENISNIGRAFVNSFSESARHSTLSGILKKVNEMTNTIESTLQSLYRYYSEMKSTWYKGDYTMGQEDVYYSVFLALQDALIKLPIQTPEDRKIKLAMLKNMVLFPCETNNGVDLSSAPNMERESLELIDQLAAE